MIIITRVQARNRKARKKKAEEKLRKAVAELDGTASDGTDTNVLPSNSSESTSMDQEHSLPVPTRPRINAGMDESAILDHSTRLSQVPSEFDPSTLEPLGVVQCSVVQLGRLMHLISRHCALCPGAFVQLQPGNGGCASNMALTLQCAKCEKIIVSDVQLNPGKVLTEVGWFYESNVRVVGGVMATGNGYADLCKMNAWQNVPTMDDETFTKIKDWLGNKLINMSDRSMLEAAEEEIALARKAGSKFIDGDGKEWPASGAIVDGGFSTANKGKQRSRAKGGCVVAIGQRTGKVIACRVKSKAKCKTVSKSVRFGRNSIGKEKSTCGEGNYEAKEAEG